MGNLWTTIKAGRRLIKGGNNAAPANLVKVKSEAQLRAERRSFEIGEAKKAREAKVKAERASLAKERDVRKEEAHQRKVQQLSKTKTEIKEERKAAKQERTGLNKGEETLTDAQRRKTEIKDAKAQRKFAVAEEQHKRKLEEISTGKMPQWKKNAVIGVGGAAAGMSLVAGVASGDKVQGTQGQYNPPEYQHGDVWPNPDNQCAKKEFKCFNFPKTFRPIPKGALDSTDMITDDAEYEEFLEY